MLKIIFDPEAYKTRTFEGPFETQAQLETACKPDAQQSQDQQYKLWATANDIDPNSGDIIVGPNYAMLQQIRRDALEQQLITGNYVAKPPQWLMQKFSEIASSVNRPLEILTISATQENVFFPLDKEFPNLKATCVITDKNHVATCNKLVEQHRPDLSKRLDFSPELTDGGYDAVYIDTALHYWDKNELNQNIGRLSVSAPKHVIIANILPNHDASGAEQWLGQRARGGILPVRVPANGEIKTQMQAAGYRLIETHHAPAAFKVDPESSYFRDVPETENYVFEFNG